MGLGIGLGLGYFNDRENFWILMIGCRDCFI